LRVFYAMHHRYRPGDCETWKYTAPIQKAAWSRKTFEFGTWGGEFRPESAPQLGDIVAQEHWCSSGFANTDLDLQLKRHGIQRLIVAGLIAHTCVESTVRFAVELGYDTTVVKDATAANPVRKVEFELSQIIESPLSISRKPLPLRVAQRHHAQPPLPHQRRLRKQLVRLDISQRLRSRNRLPHFDLYLRILGIARVH
jgi:nicotinamidase-related amidase